MKCSVQLSFATLFYKLYLRITTVKSQYHMPLVSHQSVRELNVMFLHLRNIIWCVWNKYIVLLIMCVLCLCLIICVYLIVVCAIMYRLYLKLFYLSHNITVPWS